MENTGTRRTLTLNLLTALALTLLINVSFFISWGPDHVGGGHRPPPMMTTALHITLFQLGYIFVMAVILTTVNTVRSWGLWRKVTLSILITAFFYLCVPNMGFGGHWSMPMWTFKHWYNPPHMLKCIFVVVVSVLYGQIYQLIYQKAQLKNENLQTRYNMLANQISPHFLFNSLNSLAMLVREKENDRALHYIDQLSDTFRYMLQTHSGEMTTLAEELRFTDAYVYLLTIRYEDKLFCDLQIDDTHRTWRLPVHSLQPLIENAVKHNSITHSTPLHITISTEGDTLVVSNPIIPKLDPSHGTGIGLPNLISRYQMLCGNEVQIVHTDDVFRVVLPLCPPEPTPHDA